MGNDDFLVMAGSTLFGPNAVSQTPQELHTPPVGFAPGPNPTIPVALVPTPTIEYRARRKVLRSAINSSTPTALGEPVAADAEPVGARALIWKQDPSVEEIGIRKVFLPGAVVAGPRDARISIQGTAQVSPNMLGDFIGPSPGSEAFDAIHTFAVVRQTLTMYQRALGGIPLPWQWNSAGNPAPLKVFPRAGETMNAFYSRNEQALKFFFFTKPGSAPGSPPIFTTRSLDIVAHETGHAILDALKPNWLLNGNPPQTGGLHESFGDITAIFLMLSQMDQVEAVIAQTKANLHEKTFLSDLAEEFGLALGRPNGLRNADNDLRLSQVGTEVHAISQVFTGGIYDILADIFLFKRNTTRRDDALTLYQAAVELQGLLLRAIVGAPESGATYAHVVNQMLTIADQDGKPVEYRNFIRNRFVLREVIVSPTPLNVDHEQGLVLEPYFVEPEGAAQDRRGCCGTMQHSQYQQDAERALQAEFDELNAFLEGGASLQDLIARQSD